MVGKMDQWVKCLSRKHEELSLGSQHLTQAECNRVSVTQHWEVEMGLMGASSCNSELQV